MENKKDMKLYLHDFALETSKLFFDVKGQNYCLDFSPDDSRFLAMKVISSSHTELYLVSNVDKAFDDISKGCFSRIFHDLKIIHLPDELTIIFHNGHVTGIEG